MTPDRRQASFLLADIMANRSIFRLFMVRLMKRFAERKALSPRLRGGGYHTRYRTMFDERRVKKR